MGHTATTVSFGRASDAVTSPEGARRLRPSLPRLAHTCWAASVMDTQPSPPGSGAAVRPVRSDSTCQAPGPGGTLEPLIYEGCVLRSGSSSLFALNKTERRWPGHRAHEHPRVCARLSSILRHDGELG